MVDKTNIFEVGPFVTGVVVLGGAAAIILFLSQRAGASPPTIAGVSLVDYGFGNCNNVNTGQVIPIYAALSHNNSYPTDATLTIKVNGNVIDTVTKSVPVGAATEMVVSQYTVPSYTGTQTFNLVIEIS